ncbi:MAG TPA: RHS repeat-associated core domain-containing protein [bacterium]|nr:RHS repeat-associated core domain-containing protein [bacterium]
MNYLIDESFVYPQVVSEYDDLGTVTTEYHRGLGLISMTKGINEYNYRYDALGSVRALSVNGSITNYVLCKTCRYARVIEELDGGTGTLKKSYTYGNNLLGYGIEGGLDHGYVLDGHGSVRKVTYNGIIQAEYDYNAYGELTSESGWAVAYNDFRYAGEQFDPHLDQYYLRARYYNQNVGRFSSMDTWQGSLSRPLSLNKYNYTESNPVMGIDPSGRDTILAMMAGVDAWGQHFLGSISVSTCSSCPQVTKDGGRVFLSPQMAAEDAKEYVLRNYPKNSGMAEFFAEIYRTDMGKECYSYFKPYTGKGYDTTKSDDDWRTIGWIDHVKFDKSRGYTSLGYWHSHVIPLPDELISIYNQENIVSGREKDENGFYRGRDFKTNGIHNISGDDKEVLDYFSIDHKKKYVFMNVFDANISNGGAPHVYPMNTYVRNY